MALTFYMTDLSPPCRAVMMTAKAIGVELENKEINLGLGEHKNPQFIKINPQHTVPVLIDNGVVICESHAIITYLIGKYAKDDSLYPKDLAKRAFVDQRLHFDSGVLFSLLRRIVIPIYVHGQKHVPEEQIQQIIETYDFIEKFLEGSKWIAGDRATVADLSLMATITSIQLFASIDEKKFPKITSWMKRTSELPCYSENIEGVRKFYAYFKSLME